MANPIRWMPNPPPVPCNRVAPAAPRRAATLKVEMIRVLRVARRGAMKARVQAGAQLDSIVVCPPESVRTPLRRRTGDLPTSAGKWHHRRQWNS